MWGGAHTPELAPPHSLHTVQLLPVIDTAVLPVLPVLEVPPEPAVLVLAAVLLPACPAACASHSRPFPFPFLLLLAASTALMPQPEQWLVVEAAVLHVLPGLHCLLSLPAQAELRLYESAQRRLRLHVRHAASSGLVLQESRAHPRTCSLSLLQRQTLPPDMMGA